MQIKECSEAGLVGDKVSHSFSVLLHTLLPKKKMHTTDTLYKKKGLETHGYL